MREAVTDQTHDRKMLRFTSPDLLVIDENAGTESGRIGNLNPQSVVAKK